MPKSSRITLPFVAVLFGAGALLLLGYVQARRFWQARHPAVSEHLGELIQAAGKGMGCAADSVKVFAEEPTRARVEGCGHSVTFRWGQERTRRALPHWHQIDPNCSVNYMGCNLPCE